MIVADSSCLLWILNVSQARDVIRILLNVVAYCQERNIVHRDLKPENLLLVSKEDSSAIKVRSALVILFMLNVITAASLLRCAILDLLGRWAMAFSHNVVPLDSLPQRSYMDTNIAFQLIYGVRE